MIAGLRCRLLDIGFVTALLLVAAVPLIFLRGNPLLNRTDCLVFLLALIAALVVLWAFLARSAPADPAATEPAFPDRNKSAGRLPWWQTALFAGLLGVVVVVTFFLPLRIQFWGGTDDFISFPDRPLLPLMADWDLVVNRPLTMVPSFVGQAITPNRVEGYLGLAVGLCWLNGLLLYGILRILLPQARLLPVAAALLLILDRSDPSRFYVLWISNVYWMMVALLLGSLWLFLWSYRRGSRPLLFLSCLLLTGALLTSEGPLPLALLGPLFAWFLNKHRQRLLLWTCAWAGSLALVASRFLLFLAKNGAGSYQAGQSAKAFQDPHLLWINFCAHLQAGLDNFQTSGAMVHHWKLAVVVLALVGVLVCLGAWRGAAASEAPRRRQYLWVLALAVLALLLGSIPFLHIPEVFRTQILAAPGQAVLLACVLCLAAGLLGRRAGTVVAAAILALLAANTTAETLASQQKLRARSPINFERTVHLFRQIRAIYPNPTPDSLILLFLDEPTFAPFTHNYCCLHLGRQLLGTPMVQANFDDPGGDIPVFHRQAVIVQHGENFYCAGEKNYDKVLAFRFALDGTVTLMRRLPDKLLPPDNTADRYDPLTQHRPGPVAEVPFLRFPLWASRPADLFDLSDGVLLGQGWGPLQWWQGKPSRQASNGAELVVNPLGQQQRRLCLRLAEVCTGRLEALDLENRVVAAADLNGSREVVLTVPTDPKRLSLIRLKVTSSTGTAGSCRFFCPGLQMADFQQPPPPPREIVSGELALGKNWHLLETYAGQTFRWVANDAEIILQELPPTPKDLLLDLAPGIGLGGQPCRLTVQDQTGRIVATACVRDREVLRLKLPTDTPARTVLQLHVEGGGQRIAKDPRILNFRVFHCAWQTP